MSLILVVNIHYFFTAILLTGAVGTIITLYGNNIIGEINEYDAIFSQRMDELVLDRSSITVAKGLYLTASSAAGEKKRRQIIEFIGKTELNAVVIDIKDYTGNILYDSSVPLVNEVKTERIVLKNIHSIIRDFKHEGIYVIARHSVFQDPALASAKPEWALRSKRGGVWKDYKGLSWVDPASREVWEYNMNIAREVSRLGFDEINFDYVRYPSDGDLKDIAVGTGAASKEEVLRQFFVYARARLRQRPVYVSADLFGLTLESHNFDLNIGQRLIDVVDVFDYVYPMTYPSHYPSGHLGYENPADHPYAVVKHGLERAVPLVEGRTARLRPWLQAFNLGAEYDGQKIRDQIQAVDESGITAGWMLWNASNSYSEAGLSLDLALTGR